MRFENDGIALWYGTADAPAPSGQVEAASGTEEAQVSITVGMQPPSASNSVEVTYRVNGGAPATVPAALLVHDPHQQAQYFQARLPAFHVGETVDYLVVGRAPGHQVPGPQEASQYTASFEVVPDPPAEPASGGLHLAMAKPAQFSSVARPAGLSVGAAGHSTPIGLIAGNLGSVLAAPSATVSSGGTAALPEHSGVAGIDWGAVGKIPVGPGTGPAVGASPRIQVPFSLQRIPFTIDPLSEAGAKVADTLLPNRTAAVSKFYLGIDRMRLHLQLIAGALSSRSLPGQLIGVLQQPDGTAGRLLQIQFDPSSIGSSGPKLTVVSKDDGSFTLRLPQSRALPDTGLSLAVHGANENATLTIPASQIAANGVCGSIILPRTLNPLHVSILEALTALLPAGPSASKTPESATASQLHVVKLGEEDSCQLCFKANNAIDRFPYGIFFRLVEPQTSIPHVTLRVPASRGFFPIPHYGNTPIDGAGEVTYLDRIPVEQPLSVDGFRDQIMGVTLAGTVTAEETVPMAGTLGLGYTLWMSQRWTFQGLALGDLVYSLALAPGEQQQVAIFERVDTATVRESEFFSEEEVESQAARSDTSTQATFNSAFNELVKGGSEFSAHASSSSAGGGGAFSLGIISFGGGGSSGSTDSSGTTSQWLQGQRNVTQQAAESTHSSAESQAAARRSAAHTSMRMATASESETVTTKVITNHNHTRALTLQYWEVLRLYDVTTAVDGLTLTCLVPMQVVRFLPPGQTLTLSDPSMVSNRALVMARYSSIIKHTDVLARALPRRFRYGLTLLQQFAADPTAQVEPFGGVAEDVIQFSLSGTFLPCEDIYIRAVTKRNTRVGPLKLVNPATIPTETFASREELLAALSQARQGNAPASLKWTTPTSLSGALALPPSLNRSDIVGFEFSRSFRQIDYTLVPPEIAAVNALHDLFPSAPPSWLNVGPIQFGESNASGLIRSTIRLTPGELESTLGGPLLDHFQAAIQELDAQGDLKAGAKGETYANDSLNGVELPSGPYPVPAIQIGPVLRFNQILEIEKMAQHVVRNTVMYSRAVWASMSPDERAILLEHYTLGVPSDGISDQSQMVPLLNCVENRVLGFFGNSMMLPFLMPQAVAEQMNIDPVQLQNALLAYQQEAFTAPQSTITLPTRGVLGEAVLGHCPSAEKIDLTRFWNWADSPADTAPTIAPVTLPTTTPSIAAGLTAPNTLTNLPPLINNVLTAPTPDTSLLQALSKSAASQQDFSPTLTGAQQLAGLITNAQNTANAARSDALNASTKLISQAMTTAASLLSQSGGQQSQGGGQQKQGQGQTPGTAGGPSSGAPGAGAAPDGAAGTSAADEGAGDAGAAAGSGGPSAGSATNGLSPGTQPAGDQGLYQLASYQTDGGTAGGAPSGVAGTLLTPLVAFEPDNSSAEANAAYARMRDPGTQAAQAQLRQSHMRDFGFPEIQGYEDPSAEITIADLEAVLRVSAVLAVDPSYVLALFIIEGKFPYAQVLHGSKSLDLVLPETIISSAGANRIRAWLRSNFFYQALGCDRYTAFLAQPNQDNVLLGPTANHDGAFVDQIRDLQARGIPGLEKITDQEVRNYFTNPGGAMIVETQASGATAQTFKAKLRRNSVASWIYLQFALFMKSKQLMEAKFGAEYGRVDLASRPWVVYTGWNANLDSIYSKLFANWPGGPEVAIAYHFGTSMGDPAKLSSTELALYHQKRSALANAIVYKFLIDSVSRWFVGSSNSSGTKIDEADNKGG